MLTSRNRRLDQPYKLAVPITKSMRKYIKGIGAKGFQREASTNT